ncbi:glycosyltransferase family 4 protein [Cohnella sp.]|uniref:glycosyltransferase family 4 protein n=1 Tax=Cohnella sp. TaxID=1883426 RepID=UPI0035696E3B
MSGLKPKLLLFSHICSPVYVTGAEKLLLLFTRELIRRFHCVLVVPEEGIIAERAREIGIRVIVLEIPLCISLYTATPTISEEIEGLKKHPSWSRLRSLLAEEHPSYVFVNTSVHPLPAIAAKSLGIPTIWALMETLMDTPHRDAAAGFIASHSDAVIGISHTTLQPLLGVQGAAKTFMLSPYVDREELQPGSWPSYRAHMRQQFGWSENHRVAGYIAATIYPNKGLEPFIQAMLPIAAGDARARFLVIGNPVDEAYYRNCQTLVQMSGYADRFIFHPFVEQIQQAFPAMDVVVVPSLVAEGFGMTALEGLAFGKGVAAFASGGLTEILTATGNETFLASTGDVAGLSARVNLLMSNDGFLNAVGQRNAEAAQNAYGIEAFRARLEEFLTALSIPAEVQSSLLRGSAPTVYFVENGKKRPFVSEKAFLQRGYRFEDVTLVLDEDLFRLPSGRPMFEIRHKSATRRRRRKNTTRSRKKQRTALRRRRPVSSRRMKRKAHRQRR